MGKKRVGISVMTITLGVCLAFISGQALGSDIIRIGAASAGGGYFVVGGAMASVLDAEGMDARVQTTGGGRQNAILAHAGQVDLGLTNNIEAYEEFDKKDRKNIRSIMAVFNGIHHFVVKEDQPVTNLKVLEGKPFGLTKKGSTHDVAGRQVFEILGIEPKYRNAGKSDTNNMVRDGLLVGYFITSGIPVPSISELEATTDLRFIRFTNEQYAKIRKEAPWLSEDTIPAGSYKGVKEDIKSFSSWNVLVSNKDLDDERVYNICKAIFKNAKAITRAYPAAQIDPKLVSKLVLPLHPGAVKFYREKGLDIPDRLLP
jgi:TRAP transporter TAXI family solute receptor